MAVFQRWEGPGGAPGDPASSESSSRLGWERDDGESSHLPRQTRGPAGEEQGVSATPTAFQKEDGGVFPGGSVAKNPPANAGDTGSIPGP